MTIKLTGRIDSSNAAETEMVINEQIGDYTGELELVGRNPDETSASGTGL